MRDPRDRVIDASIRWSNARADVLRLRREMRALKCQRPDRSEAPPCWQDDNVLPPAACPSCRRGYELAGERRQARAESRAALGRLERAIKALDKTLYGVAARAA